MNLRKLLLLSSLAALAVAPIAIPSVAHAQTPILVMDSSASPPNHLTPDEVEASVAKWAVAATAIVGTLAGFVVFLFGKIGEVKAQVQSHSAQLQQQQGQLNTHALAINSPPPGPSLLPASTAPAIIAALACAMLFLPGCSALKLKAQRDAAAVGSELANTDITASASYDGVTVTGGRVNGRNSVNLDVDAKQVVKAINR